MQHLSGYLLLLSFIVLKTVNLSTNRFYKKMATYCHVTSSRCDIEFISRLIARRPVGKLTFCTMPAGMENFNPDVDEHYISTFIRVITSTLSEGIAVFLLAFNISLSVAAFLGNALILVALHKVTSLHPPTKLLFRCLAVTDLCVGLVTQPLHVIVFYLPYIADIDWDIVHNVAKVYIPLSCLLCGVTLLVSTTISVDRLLALSLGLRYRQVVTLRRIRVVAISIWLAGASLALLSYFWNDPLSPTIGAALTLTAVIISVFCYTMIYVRLRQNQAAQIRHHVHQRQPIRGESAPLNIARFKKTVSSIAWVQLALVVCYVPFGVVAIIVNISGWSTISSLLWVFATSLVNLNSSLNPILYFWKMREVRQAVKDTMRQFISILG